MLRLDSVLDAVYLLGSLWGGPTGAKVCSSSLPVPVHETQRPEMLAAVTAFVNVNVIPMDTERVLADQTVVVEGDRITALGPSSKVPVPAGAIRIDGRGQYLIPGLADMHLHMATPRGFSAPTGTDEQIAVHQIPYIADGVTTVRLVEFQPSQQLERFKRLEAKGGPHIYPAGFQVVRSYGRDNKDKNNKKVVSGLKRLDSVAVEVAAAKAAGYRLIGLVAEDVRTRQEFPVVDSLLTAARRQGFAVIAHDHGARFEQALVLGAVGGAIEHLMWTQDILVPRLTGTRFGVPIEQREADLAVTKIPALAAATARAGLWVVPTLHCTVVSLPPLQTMLVRRTIKALQDAGVGLLLAGDDGYSVHDDLAAMVAAGLSPFQALRTGTYNVAKYLGLLDSTGTVAVGKRADLVLLAGNPLQDIRYTREPAGVMFHGQWLDRAELDRRLLVDYKYPVSRDDMGGGFGSWFRLGMLDGGLIPRRDLPSADTYKSAASQIAWAATRTPQSRKFLAHIERFEALSDSLTAAQSQGQAGASAAQRLRQQLAEEFGAMRAMLPPEQYAAFDPVARLWLREQARQGHSMTVQGVAPTLDRN